MTDESHGIDPMEEVPAPVESQPEPMVTSVASEFTSGEGLVALAGLVLIADWIIFGLIINEYGPGFLFLLIAVAAAVLPRLNRATVEKAHPLPLLMKVAGYAIVILAVLSLIEDLRFDSYDDFASVLGALVLYAAGVLAFIGARQIKI